MGAEPLRQGALVELESTVVELLDAAPDGILLVAADGRIVFSNEAAQQLFGYARDELAGERVETLVPARHRSAHAGDRETYTSAPQRRPMGVDLELHGLRRDGTEFPVEVSLSPLTTSRETLIVTIVRDATEQRVIEEQHLRYARSQAVEEIVSGLEAIVWEGAAPDRGSMSYLGGREAAFLGYTPERWLTAGFWLSVVHPEDRITALTFAEAARERETFDLEYRLIDSGGAVHHVRDLVAVKRDERGEIVRLSGVIVDITERRELEARLFEAQKMEAVGQLAGGIAHDFNNLLTIASIHAQRLRERADLTRAHDDLDQIIAATDRAAELTWQLLAFSRRGHGNPELLDPNETVRALEPMLRRLIDADIAFVFELDDDVPKVLMDATELEQIVMNLIINASDAMREGGGTLTVTSRSRKIVAEDAALHESTEGDGVQLSVSDSGVGIPAELLDRIFEPFFTTKHDEGTGGMGLATVYGIVKHAGGWIDVETVLGTGTTFHVELPAASPSERRGGADEAVDRPTLLLVEDEPALRHLIVTMLTETGYAVLEAANGLDAIAVAERHGGPLDLLITDVVIPRLSGPELAQRLRRLRPGLEVLFMSGYNDSRLVSRGVEDANVNLLVKPFTPDELFAAVAERLTAERS
jgi:two-component system, cell cycle sensor histidine kinase and response regulator CckA